jgi:hypothetical protein
MYLEGFIDFHHGPGKGAELRRLIAKAEGPAIMEEPFWRRFWDAMVDEYDEFEINSPNGLQAILEQYLGFPRTIKPRGG